VPCGEIALDDPDSVAGFRPVLDQVAVSPEFIPGSSPLQESGLGTFRYFAKIGINVRKGGRDEVEVRIPRKWRSRIAISWGNAAPPVASVTFDRCPGSTKWAGYAGGFFVNAPVCAPFIVRVGQRTQILRVGVGVRCPKPTNVQ
jgi:hypothetical protein